MKQIILMRTDIKMPKGKMIAQGAHASVKAYLHYKDHPNMDIWLAGSFTKIVVKVDSEEELSEAFILAQLVDIPRSLIIDEGRTVFNGVPTLTCGCIGPAPSEVLDKITGNKKLL